MERYTLRLITNSSDDETELDGYTAERALQCARAFKDSNIVNIADTRWVIYDRQRGMIVAEDDRENGGWINPKWLITVGLSE